MVSFEIIAKFSRISEAEIPPASGPLVVLSVALGNAFNKRSKGVRPCKPLYRSGKHSSLIYRDDMASLNQQDRTWLTQEIAKQVEPLRKTLQDSLVISVDSAVKKEMELPRRKGWRKAPIFCESGVLLVRFAVCRCFRGAFRSASRIPSMNQETAAIFTWGRSVFFLRAGVALRTASRTIRR